MTIRKGTSTNYNRKLNHGKRRVSVIFTMPYHDPFFVCGPKVRLVYSFTGFLIGISVLIVFGFRFQNWNAALWGLISGLAALATFFVHLWYVKERWESKLSTLNALMLTGCFIQLAGVVGFAVYLALAISNDQGLLIEGPGYYLTMVWCFMTWKWGFSLFLFSRIYRRIYMDAYDSLN